MVNIVVFLVSATLVGSLCRRYNEGVVSAASWINQPPPQQKLQTANLQRHQIKTVFTCPSSAICSSVPVLRALLSIRRQPCMNQIIRKKLFMAMDDDTDEDEDDDEDDDDEDLGSSLDTSNFLNSHLNRPDATIPTFGLYRGRSSPSQRKAMGTSTNSKTTVHVCTNCSSEFVKWMGRCPTCRQWNTLQEYSVTRSTAAASALRPNFNSLLASSSSSSSSIPSRPLSWLDGTPATSNNMGWVRVTDLYPQAEGDDKDESNNGKSSFQQRRRTAQQQRTSIPGDDELNNVLGGGIMRGSLILLGGDPGVGKSTLALQTAGSVASLSTKTQQRKQQLREEQQQQQQVSAVGSDVPNNKPQQVEEGPVWYISGEENAEQIASRAFRLGIFQPELWLMCETHLDTIAELVVQTYHPRPTSNRNNDLDDDDRPTVPLQQQTPSLLVIDSIQTMVCEAGGSSAAGGVTQVRESVALLLRLAKSTGIPVLLIGHVTKDGTVAGPRTIEHMVDCVLYLEGTSESMSSRDTHSVRLLRAAKNRFGSADELGVYEMTTGRLLPVSDPSSLFLSHRPQLDEDEDDEDDKSSTEGCAIALMLEGRRAMTVEVQALVTPMGTAGVGGRRTVNGGVSTSRLLLLLGVLQKRCGMFWAKQDVYLNVVGQTLRWERSSSNSNANNAADLAVAMACVSSLLSIPVRPDAAFCGEVGLLGELRKMSPSALTKRLQEARRMGFKRVVTPKISKSPHEHVPKFPGMEWIQCGTLMAALNAGLTAPVASARRRGSSAKRRPDSSSSSTTATTVSTWSKGGWKSNAAPASLRDLMLDDGGNDDDDDDAILDDEDDDDASFQ